VRRRAAVRDERSEPRERARKWGWGPRLQRSLTEATSPRGRIGRDKTGLSAETNARLLSART
jgi:hypothetical protein